MRAQLDQLIVFPLRSARATALCVLSSCETFGRTLGQFVDINRSGVAFDSLAAGLGIDQRLVRLLQAFEHCRSANVANVVAQISLLVGDSRFRLFPCLRLDSSLAAHTGLVRRSYFFDVVVSDSHRLLGLRLDRHGRCLGLAFDFARG